MALRISRRTFVGRLARAASVTVAGLLTIESVAGTRMAQAATLSVSVSGRADRGGGVLAAVDRGPVRVRMADLTIAGRDFRAGQADGIRLPGQGGDTWSLAAERPGASYTTSVLQATFPCTHVGVHWRTDGGDRSGLRVELRASRDGQNWSAWRPVMPEAHGPDRDARAGALETFGVLVGVRLATWLQARLIFDRADPTTATVDALTLTYLDSRRDADLTPPAPLSGAERGEQDGASSAPTVGSFPVGAELAPSESYALAPSESDALALSESDALALLNGRALILRAGPTSFLDRVVTRESWGADESLRFKDGLNQWPAAYVTPSLLVVHHTASDGDIGDGEADVRAIYAYHAVTQGWGDIGYHLLIDSSGRVYEGRYGREPDATVRREIVSENVVAGHALDYNYGSVGIALLGNFQVRQPGTAQIDALVDALAFMALRSGIDVTAAQNYVRVRGDQTALWRDALRTVSGHRDCIATECPGDNLYRLLPAIRQRVEEQLGGRGPAVRITRGPTARNPWPGDLAFEWEGDPSVVEVSTRLAAFRRVVGSDRIEPLSGYADDERAVWSPWTRDRALVVPLLPDAKGIYTLLVRARDARGQEGRVSARWPVVVDRHVVVDDADSALIEAAKSMEPNREILGYYGGGYHQAAPGQSAALFRWQLSVPEDGTYRLQAVWTEAPDRATQAVYRLSQGGVLLGDATVDQQTPGGKWGPVLEASLSAGQSCIVELDGATDGVVVADAVRLVLVP